MQLLELPIRLPTKECVNPIQIHLCFPKRFNKFTNIANDIDANMIPVITFLLKFKLNLSLIKSNLNKKIGR